MSKITKINVGGTDYEIGGSGGGVMTEISYSDLKSLAESSGLIPGNKYRITDYVTTVDSTKTYPYKSAEHPFDIVVTAITDSALDANAKAMPHEGDESWKAFFGACHLVNAVWRVGRFDSVFPYCVRRSVTVVDCPDIGVESSCY